VPNKRLRQRANERLHRKRIGSAEWFGEARESGTLVANRVPDLRTKYREAIDLAQMRARKREAVLAKQIATVPPAAVLLLAHPRGVMSKIRTVTLFALVLAGACR
jgi:hypothetical protein